MDIFRRASFMYVLIVSVLLLGASRLPAGHSHADHMQMVAATSPAAFAAAAPAPLPRTGWTATASDNYTYDVPANVLDGNATTIWHSKWDSTPPVPLPHSITVDMHAAATISGFSYLPRQDGTANGTIGQYSIATSTDGTTFSAPIASGTWADDATEKTVTFANVSARYVRLTATTEAGNRGPWSAAAEINLLGPTTTPPPILPRAGWTATASDATTYDVPANAIDGNTASFWHSKWDSTPPVPLPHSITIDMHVTAAVSGLNYLPRQDGASNGTIGQYSIATSTDGATFSAPVASGTWADDATEKMVTFPTVSTRYVRLTATTEAGNRGPWSSAAEINLLGQGTGGNGLAGSWSAPIGFPLVPVSAVLLQNNKLLTFSAYSVSEFDYTTAVTQVAIMDLTTNTVSQATQVDTHHQMFCSGITMMPDGRVLISGGSNDGATTIYNPITNTWIAGPLMTIPRAYQGNTLLSNGKVFTIGGSWTNQTTPKNAEIFTPSGTTGSWAGLPGVSVSNILTNDPEGVYRADNHAWLVATSNGGVFHAGPSKQMNWITTTGVGTIKSAGLRGDSPDMMNGDAVVYDTGKILAVGGSTAYQGAPATNRAYTIDITGGPTVPVKVARVSDMSYARGFNNAVVLPDGKVLVMGGQPNPYPFTDTDAVLRPELWDPATGKFSVLAAAAVARDYHSVGVLLPDARVFSGGGGLCFSNCTTNHPDGEIFTPPYLLNADGTLRTRPTITAAPASATTGTTITVTTNSATPKFSLIRTTAVTHAVNNDQRRISLTPKTTTGTTYTLTIPSDKGVALPGYYLLFALNASGTPSTAKYIKIN